MSPALEVVGREAEIDSVHDFLKAVPGGPIALLIEGEIGIGKTTLWRDPVLSTNRIPVKTATLHQSRAGFAGGADHHAARSSSLRAWRAS